MLMDSDLSQQNVGIQNTVLSRWQEVFEIVVQKTAPFHEKARAFYKKDKK